MQCEEEVPEKVHGGDAGQQLGAEHLRVEAATFGEQLIEQQELDPGAEQLAEQAVDVAAGKEADGLLRLPPRLRLRTRLRASCEWYRSERP